MVDIEGLRQQAAEPGQALLAPIEVVTAAGLGQQRVRRDMSGGAAARAAAQVQLGDLRREALSQLAGIGLGVRLGPGAAGQAAAGEQAGQRRARK